MDKNLTIRDIIETDGLIYPEETRVITRLADQLQGVPAQSFGLTGTDNEWSGDQTFTGAVNFDGTTDFDGADVFDGAVTINSVPSLAGGAILFPATQVPSANANALDDYEEGTFTPTIVGVTTPGVGTYTTQIGRYTKIGRVVYVEVVLVWTAHTGTGAFRIDSLPFTVSATFNTPCSIVVSDLTFSNQVAARFVAGSTQIQPITMSTGAAISAITIDTAATVQAAGFYVV